MVAESGKIRMLVPVDEEFDWTRFCHDWSQAATNGGFAPVPLADTPAGPLTAWEKPGPGPHVYLSAGIHGDEPACPLALLHLLRDGFFHGDANWSVCPALNPTGLAAGTRGNADGEDLNRDYWLRRIPEVQAHAKWLESFPSPDLFISLHEDWETGGFYFYEINLGPDRPDRAAAILAAVSDVLPIEPSLWVDGHEVRDAGWIYHEAEADLPRAWPEAIFLAKHGCPLSFTFETPSSAAPLANRVAALAAAVRAAWKSHIPSSA